MNIYDILKKLEINYDEVKHKAVFTIAEAEFIKSKIIGIGVKNLFIKDKNNFYYLVLLEDTEKLDFKKLTKFLEVSSLKFASELELNNILSLSKGSVTPLGIINDKNNQVTLIISKKLVNQILLVHPNINTATINIKCSDLIKLLNYTNHQYLIF